MDYAMCQPPVADLRVTCSCDDAWGGDPRSRSPPTVRRRKCWSGAVAPSVKTTRRGSAAWKRRT